MFLGLVLHYEGGVFVENGVLPLCQRFKVTQRRAGMDVRRSAVHQTIGFLQHSTDVQAIPMMKKVLHGRRKKKEIDEWIYAFVNNNNNK